MWGLLPTDSVLLPGVDETLAYGGGRAVGVPGGRKASSSSSSL